MIMKKIKIENKKRFFICFCIFIIIFVISICILVNIIISKNENKVSKAYEKSNRRSTQSKIADINTYTQTDNVADEIQKTYLQEIEELLNVENIDSLYLKTNKKFLEKNNLNEDNFKEYILKNEYVGRFPTSTSFTSSVQRNGSYIYRFRCYRDDRTKFYVNLIETQPFEYTVDFSQDTIPTQDSGEYTYYNNEYELEFNVIELERTEDTIAYQLKVTNNSDKEIEFYLNNISDMSLKISTESGNNIEGYVKQISSVLSSRKYILNKDSYFVKKMYFALDMQYHSKVEGMIFYNVRIEDINKNLEITF